MPRLSDTDAGLLLGAIQQHGVDVMAVNSKYQIPCPICSIQRNKANATPCGLLVVNVGRVNMCCQHCAVEGFVDTDSYKKEDARYGGGNHPPVPPKPKEYNRPERMPKALKWDDKMTRGFEERCITEAVRQKFGVIKAECTVGKDANGNWEKVDAICFPYYNGDDLILLKYRFLRGKEFRQSPKPEPSIYNINGLREHIAGEMPIKSVVICEGELDVMALETCGIRNAVTSNLGASKKNNVGTAQLYFKTPELTQCSSVVLAGDCDGPGNDLMETIANTVGRDRCTRVDWTMFCTDECVVKTGEKNNKGELVLNENGEPMTRVCKDAGDVLLRHGVGNVHNCINEAEPMGEKVDNTESAPSGAVNQAPTPPPADLNRHEQPDERGETPSQSPDSASPPAPAPKSKTTATDGAGAKAGGKPPPMTDEEKKARRAEKEKAKREEAALLHDWIVDVFFTENPDIYAVYKKAEEPITVNYMEWRDGCWSCLIEKHIEFKLRRIIRNIGAKEKHLNKLVKEIIPIIDELLYEKKQWTLSSLWNANHYTRLLADGNRSVDLRGGFKIIDTVREHKNYHRLPVTEEALLGGVGRILDGSSKWLGILKDWHDDPNVIHYLQVMCGQAHVGNKCQIALFLTGAGQNGKSAFLKSRGKAYGRPFVDITPSDVFEKIGRNPMRTDSMLNMSDALFAHVSEMSSGAIINGKPLKNATGDDEISARGNYKDAVDINPVVLPCFAVNEIPKFAQTGEAMRRRIRVVGFKKNQENSEMSSSEFDELILTLAPDIIAWDLLGLADWNKNYKGIGDQEPTVDSIVEDSADVLDGDDDFAHYFFKMVEDDPQNVLKRQDFVDAFKEREPDMARRMQIETKCGRLAKGSFRVSPYYGKWSGEMGFYGLRLMRNDNYGGGGNSGGSGGNSGSDMPTPPPPSQSDARGEDGGAGYDASDFE